MAGNKDHKAPQGTSYGKSVEVIPLADVASLFHCSIRQVNTYISQGLLPALRRPSGRVVGVPKWALDDFTAPIEQ